MRSLWPCAALVSVAAWSSPRVAAAGDDGPDAPQLIGLGAALTLPADLLVTTQHEGSHALAATLFGAHVTSVRPYPIEVDGHLRFGQTTWTGTLSPGQHVAVMLAPKVTDLVGLATYGALETSGHLPEDGLAGVALLTLATAVWVDFTVDIGATWDKSDLGVVYSIVGANDDMSRLPYRLVQGGIAAVAAVPIVRGYTRLFARRPARPRETVRASVEPWADVLGDVLGSARGEIFGVRGTF